MRENFKWGECENLILHSSSGVQRANARADSRTRKTPAATRWEDERSPLPVRVAPWRVRKGDVDEDYWNWRIDMDFYISNESLDHQLDEYWGFLAHELQMTVRHHDFIFQASIVFLTKLTDN